MKKVGLIVLVFGALLAFPTGLLAQDPTQLSSVQCDPLSCEEYTWVPPGWAGYVETDIYGQCYNGRAPSAVAGVSAVNCLTWVFLDSYGAVTSEQKVDDFGNLYTVEGVRAFASASASGGGMYWSMARAEDCEGGVFERIQPPTPC